MYFLSSLFITGVKSAHFTLDTVVKILPEEGRRKEVDLVFISLDNMGLSDNSEHDNFLYSPGYSERMTTVKSFENILLT